MKASISEIRRLHKTLRESKSLRDVFLFNGEFKTILARSSRSELIIQDPQMTHKWAGTYSRTIIDSNGDRKVIPIEFLLEDFSERSEDEPGAGA